MKRLLFFLFLLYSGFCFSATFTVTNSNDVGVGSLKAALAATENNGSADTIIFSGDMTININGNNRFWVMDNEGLVIDAQGQNIVIDGTNMTGTPLYPLVGIWITDTNYNWPPWGRICGNATIKGITFRNCAYGGALVSSGSKNNTFIDCTFYNNSPPA